MSIGFEVNWKVGAEPVASLLRLEDSPKDIHSFVSVATDRRNRITVLAMGEIHYQFDLRTQYSLPDCPEQRSAAECVLEIYQAKGRTALAGLEGEFSLVVIDRNFQLLIAMRDPLGRFPLFYACHRTGVSVGTSLAGLNDTLGGCPINRDYLALFLMHSSPASEVQSEQTVRSSLYRVLPGQISLMNPHGLIQCEKYWNWEDHLAMDPSWTLETAAEEFRSLFRAALQERVLTGAASAHLSGGMDSTAVVCMVRELLQESPDQRSLKTLSLVYEGLGLSRETELIQSVLDQGGPVEKGFIRGDNCLDFDWFLPGLPAHDEPYSGLFRIGMHRALFDQAAAHRTPLVLTGGGAEVSFDSIRLGLADKLKRGKFRTAWREARRAAQGRNVSPWSILWRSGLRPLLPAALQEGIGVFLRKGFARWPNLGSHSIPPWILSQFAKETQLWSRGLANARLMTQGSLSDATRLAYLRGSLGDWYSWNLGLPQGVRNSHPFTDVRILRFGLSLPVELRNCPGKKEPVLQEAMKQLMPEQILNRKYKTSFNDPFWVGLASNLPNLEAMIEHSGIHDLKLFDRTALVYALRQHALGIGDPLVGGRLNSTLALIAWFDRIQKSVSLERIPIPHENSELEPLLRI